jgi:hypothetical protein
VLIINATTIWHPLYRSAVVCNESLVRNNFNHDSACMNSSSPVPNLIASYINIESDNWMHNKSTNTGKMLLLHNWLYISRLIRCVRSDLSNMQPSLPKLKNRALSSNCHSQEHTQQITKTQSNWPDNSANDFVYSGAINRIRGWMTQQQFVIRIQNKITAQLIRIA